MLILHTAQSYPPEVSGIPEVLMQLSTRLARRGHEVHVATAQTGAVPNEEMRDGVLIHRFDVAGNAAFGVRGEPDAYLGFVRSRSWDVIAMHCAQIWSTDLLLPFLQEVSGVKIFVGHGLLISDARFETYYARFASLIRHVDRIVSLSELVEVTPFCRKYGLPEPEVIPNGVDLSRWGPETLRLRKSWKIKGRPWLLCVSNHTPYKGHRAFFDVIRAIRREIPQAQGTIVGQHHPIGRWHLGRLGIKGGCWYQCQASARFSKGVSLKTGIPREEAVSAFKEADVVLIPSSWEASPLAMLESMAACTPWVSFDVGCARENVGGIVVESIEEMSAAVIRLLRDPEQRKRLGVEGRERIRQKHDWERITDRYEQLYQSLLADKVLLSAQGR
jgi:L-malate glycosyltransferase